MDTRFCLEALEEALQTGCPEIFNSDQGVQFTAEAFTSVLERKGIKISMDGKGRALDNIFIERFWRSLKYEDIYIKRYENGKEAVIGISTYIAFYNDERPHQSLVEYSLICTIFLMRGCLDFIFLFRHIIYNCICQTLFVARQSLFWLPVNRP